MGWATRRHLHPTCAHAASLTGYVSLLPACHARPLLLRLFYLLCVRAGQHVTRTPYARACLHFENYWGKCGRESSFGGEVCVWGGVWGGFSAQQRAPSACAPAPCHVCADENGAYVVCMPCFAALPLPLLGYRLDMDSRHPRHRSSLSCLKVFTGRWT